MSKASKEFARKMALAEIHKVETAERKDADKRLKELKKSPGYKAMAADPEWLKLQTKRNAIIAKYAPKLLPFKDRLRNELTPQELSKADKIDWQWEKERSAWRIEALPLLRDYGLVNADERNPDTPAALLQWIENKLVTLEMIGVGQPNQGFPREEAANVYNGAFNYALDMRKANPSFPKLPEKKKDPHAGLDELRDWCITAANVRAASSPQQAKAKAAGRPATEMIAKSFAFEPGRALFKERDLMLTTGMPVNVLKELVKRFDRCVRFKILDSTHSHKYEASDQLRQSILQIRHAFKKEKVPCQIKNKKGEGYLLTNGRDRHRPSQIATK